MPSLTEKINTLKRKIYRLKNELINIHGNYYIASNSPHLKTLWIYEENLKSLIKESLKHPIPYYKENLKKFNNDFILIKKIDTETKNSSKKLELYIKNKEIELNNLLNDIVFFAKLELLLLEDFEYLKNSFKNFQDKLLINLEKIKRKEYNEYKKNNKEKFENIKKTIKTPLLQVSSFEKTIFHRVVSLKEISFHDNYFTVIYKKYKCYCSFEKSREFFQDIFERTLHSYENNIFIELLANKRTPSKIIDCGFLDSILEHLNVVEIVNKSHLGDINELLNSIESWPFDKLYSTFFRKSKNVYLHYLAQNYSTNFKVVPVIERRENESGSTSLPEISFIFSFKRDNEVFLVWENENISRATYIFKTSEIFHHLALQKLYDYIVSLHITNKRERLRTSRFQYFNNDHIIFLKSVNHNDYLDWTYKLRNHIR